jgi:hypothetical protein
MQAVVKLALESPFKLRMVQISWVQLEIICMNRDGRILELDHDFHALTFAARGKVQQGMLIKPELSPHSIQARAAVIGHKTILTATPGCRGGQGGETCPGDNASQLTAIFSSSRKHRAPTDIQIMSLPKHDPDFGPGMEHESATAMARPMKPTKFVRNGRNQRGRSARRDRKIRKDCLRRDRAVSVGGVLKLKKARLGPGLCCW